MEKKSGSKTEMFAALQELFFLLSEKTITGALSPEKLRGLLSEEFVQAYTPQNAFKFFSLLLKEIETTLRNYPKLEHLNKLFKARKRVQVHCTKCGNTFKQLDERQFIDLPLPKNETNVVSVTDLMRTSLLPPKISPFECKKCGERKLPANASYHVETWPPILMLHLVRYREDELKHTSKILSTPVEIQEVVHTGDIIPESGIQHSYVLYAVVVQQVNRVISCMSDVISL